ATLSRPLPAAFTAGAHPAATLRYEPFDKPQLPDGSPNPRFERTLSGWLDYVATVTHVVRDVLGSDDFDVEVWNELGFGSAFLNLGAYYNPLPDVATGSPDAAILARTVAWLRDPGNGVSDVG